MTTASFGSYKSTQRPILPSFFFTTTIGDTHSDSFTRSIMPSCSNLANSTEACSRNISGNRLTSAATGFTLARSFISRTTCFASSNCQRKEKKTHTVPGKGVRAPPSSAVMLVPTRQCATAVAAQHPVPMTLFFVEQRRTGCMPKHRCAPHGPQNTR